MKTSKSKERRRRNRRKRTRKGIEGETEGEKRVGCVEDYSVCIELQLYCAVRCLVPQKENMVV